MADLNKTNTNSGNNSAGKIFGIKNEYYYFVFAGVFLALICVMVGVLVEQVIFGLLCAAGGFSLCIGYVLVFKHNRPPSYDIDTFELWLAGDHWETNNQQPRHPYAE